MGVPTYGERNYGKYRSALYVYEVEPIGIYSYHQYPHGKCFDTEIMCCAARILRRYRNLDPTRYHGNNEYDKRMTLPDHFKRINRPRKAA